LGRGKKRVWPGPCVLDRRIEKSDKIAAKNPGGESGKIILYIEGDVTRIVNVKTALRAYLEGGGFGEEEEPQSYR